jgi:hypothetical protein
MLAKQQSFIITLSCQFFQILVQRLASTFSPEWLLSPLTQLSTPIASSMQLASLTTLKQLLPPPPPNLHA